MITKKPFKNSFFGAVRSALSEITSPWTFPVVNTLDTPLIKGGKKDYAKTLRQVNLCGSLSGSLFLLLLVPGKGWAQTSPLVESATPSEGAMQIEAGKAEGALSEAEFVVGSAYPTGVNSDWVADSLVRLEQAMAAQQTSGVQGDSLGLSSTDSADLQPVESPLASEDIIQAPLEQSADIAQAAPTQPQSEQWHFLLVPYVYVPFFISGSANYEGSEDFRNNFCGALCAAGITGGPPGSGNSGNIDGSRDFDFTPTQIRTSLRNSLNFAFLGGFEAWAPDYKLGVLANLDYLSLSSNDTLTRSVRRPGFADFVPTEINASLNTQIWNGDLAASYRFYDPAKANPQGLNTEFDLGPFVFDVLGGLNVTSLNTQLGLSTNLGGDGEFTTSNTVVSPLLGGRFRWNATPKLAVLLSGSVSGFGISGLTQYGVRGGVDWMFSGNTSLGLGYRFGFLDYNSGANELDLNVDQNGPYLNFGFRF
jgi:hypothetical protein